MQRIVQSAFVLVFLSFAGWFAYEHFSSLIFEKLPQLKPIPDNPPESPPAIPPEKSKKSDQPIVIPQKTEDLEKPEDSEG